MQVTNTALRRSGSNRTLPLPPAGVNSHRRGLGRPTGSSSSGFWTAGGNSGSETSAPNVIVSSSRTEIAETVRHEISDRALRFRTSRTDGQELGQANLPTLGTMPYVPSTQPVDGSSVQPQDSSLWSRSRWPPTPTGAEDCSTRDTPGPERSTRSESNRRSTKSDRTTDILRQRRLFRERRARFELAGPSAHPAKCVGDGWPTASKSCSVLRPTRSKIRCQDDHAGHTSISWSDQA